MEIIQQSDWYNATEDEIVRAAETQCEMHVGIGATLSKITRNGMIAVIEDDLGDVVYSTPNCTDLFTEAAAARKATTDYLPEHQRRFHRSLHRRAIKSLIPDEYEMPAGDKRWTVEFFPFREREETFTLTLFSSGNSEKAAA